MSRRFNFTKRRRIYEAEAKISVVQGALSAGLTIKLEQTFAREGGYDEEDEVFIEAVQRIKVQRCRLGKILELQTKPIITVTFSSFKDEKEVHYRIRVVDFQTKKLKALAKNLHQVNRAQKSTELDSILPVALSVPEDQIGERFWKVSCLMGTNDPVLILSSKKFSSYDSVRSAEFKALVWPEVLRQVLTYAYILHWNSPPEWSEKWARFVTENLGIPGIPDVPTNADDDYITKTADWIESAVCEFASRFSLSDVTIKGLTTTEDGNE